MANLEFRYGPMNSGKSMALLQMAYNYEENNKKVVLIKPSIDTKGEDYLVSRIGPKRKVDIKLLENESLLCDKYIKSILKADAILVDEAQFLTKKQVEELWIISKNIIFQLFVLDLKQILSQSFLKVQKEYLN